MKRLFAVLVILFFAVGVLFAASEIHVNYDTGLTLYFVRFNSTGQAALSNGSAFEDWVSADTYDVALTEVGVGGHYVGNWGSVAEGQYSFTAFKQAGANPANGDEKIAIGDIVWSGTAELFGPTKAEMDTGNNTILNNISAADVNRIADLNDVILASTGLNQIPTTDPNGVADTFPEMIVQTWRRFFKKATMTNTYLKTYNDADVNETTQTVSNDGITQTVGDAE